jgi:hypothetical protein
VTDASNWQRNAPWSRGECAQCGQDVLLARAYPTYGAKLCETCEAFEQAEVDWKKRVAEVVAELRERSEAESKSGRFSYDTKEAYHDGREQAYESAADLVAEKLGVGS